MLFLLAIPDSTVVYATHIFDGLDDWASHIGYVAGASLTQAASHLLPPLTSLPAAPSCSLCHPRTLLPLALSVLPADRTLVKFGEAESFPELLAHRKNGTVAPLLRTIEGWLRQERDGRRKAGCKMSEGPDCAIDELRGPAGNGYLSGRFNGGFN